MLTACHAFCELYTFHDHVCVILFNKRLLTVLLKLESLHFCAHSMMKIAFFCVLLTITIDVISNTLPHCVSIPAFAVENGKASVACCYF